MAQLVGVQVAMVAQLVGVQVAMAAQFGVQEAVMAITRCPWFNPTSGVLGHLGAPFL